MSVSFSPSSFFFFVQFHTNNLFFFFFFFFFSFLLFLFFLLHLFVYVLAGVVVAGWLEAGSDSSDWVLFEESQRMFGKQLLNHKAAIVDMLAEETMQTLTNATGRLHRGTCVVGAPGSPLGSFTLQARVEAADPANASAWTEVGAGAVATITDHGALSAVTAGMPLPEAGFVCQLIITSNFGKKKKQKRRRGR